MTLTTVQALTVLADVRRDEDVVIATMTAAFRWPGISRAERDLCYVAPMGSALGVALGLATARPDLRVFVLDGDGSVHMNLGTLATVGYRAPVNLVHVVLLNGGYSITGGQPLPAGDGTRLAPFARAAGFAAVHEIDDAAALRDALADVPGPTFLAVRVEPGYDRTATGEQTNSARALRTQGGPGFHRLRAELARSA